MMGVLPRLVAILVALVVVVSACSEPSMSTSEYAAGLEEDTDAYIAESQTLSLRFQRTVEDEVALLAESSDGDLMLLATEVTSRETVLYLSLLEDAMMRYVAALEALAPPPALQDAHVTYVVAVESVRAAMPATRDAIAASTDLDSIQIALTGSGFSDGQLRLRAACVSLEEAVRGQGQGVDLGCTRPPAGG